MGGMVTDPGVLPPFHPRAPPHSQFTAEKGSKGRGFLSIRFRRWSSLMRTFEQEGPRTGTGGNVDGDNDNDK
eukprot:8041479-Pyramimonas_sp.AAC.1